MVAVNVENQCKMIVFSSPVFTHIMLWYSSFLLAQKLSQVYPHPTDSSIVFLNYTASYFGNFLVPFISSLTFLNAFNLLQLSRDRASPKPNFSLHLVSSPFVCIPFSLHHTRLKLQLRPPLQIRKNCVALAPVSRQK